MKIDKIIGYKNNASNVEFAQNMRDLCASSDDVFEINAELWLEIAERLEKVDRNYENLTLKKDLGRAMNRAEELERKLMFLEEEVNERRELISVQKGKIEAYEFALRCLGGKNGN